MNTQTSNDVLLVLDASYIAYFITMSAVTRWKSQYYQTSLETITLPEVGSVPYEELPDLVNDTFYFKKVLQEVAVEKLNIINDIVLNTTGHFYTGAAGVNRVDTVFARDSHTTNMFRRALFPDYKAQRNAARADRNDFNHWKVFEYIYTTVFPTIFPHNNTHTILVPDAEGDDVIATIIRSPELRDKYRIKILISSDHDFCQLHRAENHMRQFTLKGEEVLCEFKRTVKGQKVVVPITPEQALLMKIITGDSSDNIPGIKRLLGPVGAYKLVNENARENLNKLFAEDKEAAVAFQRNRKLIDFDEIPKELQESIVNAFNNEFKSE